MQVKCESEDENSRPAAKRPTTGIATVTSTAIASKGLSQSVVDVTLSSEVPDLGMFMIKKVWHVSLNCMKETS